MKYFVYILKTPENHTYVGCTTDINKRLEQHNKGISPYTKRYAGKWVLKWYCCFYDRNKALEFEKYLKTGSGIAFFKKRML